MATVEMLKPQLREITPDGRLRLHVHPGQWRMLQSKARFIFGLAGTQGGKTSILPHWLDQEIHTWQERLHGHGDKGAATSVTPAEGVGDFLAVTSTYDQFKLKMLPEMNLVFEEILRIGRYWGKERVIELSEGLVPGGRFLAKNSNDRMYGRIILRSAEAKAGLEAATIKATVLDEVGQPEYTLDTWESVLRRLSLHQGRVLGVSTLYNLGWLKTEVFDKWAAGDTNFEVVQFDSTMNPSFPVEEFERARESMPPWKFDMFHRGRYAKPAGLVYACFDEAACVIDPFPIPENWLWYAGHDFGGSNPAALLYAQDPATGLLYLVEEYFPGAKSVHDQVWELKAKVKGRTVLRRIGGSHQEGGWRDDYTSQGWPIMEPVVNDVAVGIARVYGWHKRNGIMVFRSCKRYLDEKLSYSYKLGDGYNVLDEIQDKSRFHLMDAERYLVSSFPHEAVQRHGPSQVARNRF